MLYTVRTPKELENDDYSYRQALCLGDEELHWDGGEPEDQYYFRKWAWVPGLLNKEKLGGLNCRLSYIIFLTKSWMKT